ncbi:transcriptional Coactivator p15-domain-containing protein [Lipomyces tetrasporus]|uniref:Transcriptional Coactivator p15-domain-containing protein n=1 Tax=Lipomyces tetrasporus TaxID=54092 RepID=A0AAD7QZ92_9ASCO|nr:transcriptional Coactivator p15-domain-containing protein [Lipomyces tetrasporus]KAJ8104210.1 transcriptional Coactivator p15-domain-containing protein [Lipomyces tetrasporus]
MPPKRFSSTQTKSGYKSNHTSGDYKRAKVKLTPDDEDESNGSSVLDIDIGKRKRLLVRDFKGTPLVDIREFYSKTNPDGSEIWLPGRKGISLTIDVWEAVVAHIGDIENAIKKLREGDIDTKEEAGDDDLKGETEAEIKGDGESGSKFREGVEE